MSAPSIVSSGLKIFLYFKKENGDKISCYATRTLGAIGPTMAFKIKKQSILDRHGLINIHGNAKLINT
jgi:hypothetical protein